MNDGRYVLQKEGDYDVDMEMGEDTILGLQDLIIEHDIGSWNGFEKRAEDRYLTTSNNTFGIEITYDDKTVISAHGDHAFPEGYMEAETALIEFFRDFVNQYRLNQTDSSD